MIGDVFKNLASGSLRLVRCGSVLETLAELEIRGQADGQDRRVVALTWRELPALAEILDDGLNALARTALGLWPCWYGRDLVTSREAGHGGGEIAAAADNSLPDNSLPDDDLANRLPAALADDVRRRLLPSWVRAAVRSCRADGLPRQAGYSRAAHAGQLALVIDPRRLLLVLCVEDGGPKPGRLFALARAAEWFSKQTAAAVLVLVPASLPLGDEMESIDFDTLEISESVEGDQPRLGEGKEEKEEEKAEFTVWPFHGRPHPASPGEQRLAEALQGQADLADLFEFNQDVRTEHDRRYVADLLWRSGRVVVEVDGYRWHGDRTSFCHDRHRDYELTISGYLVLRLPHQEVISDTPAVLRKIRDVVAFRRRHPLVPNGDDS